MKNRFSPSVQGGANESEKSEQVFENMQGENRLKGLEPHRLKESLKLYKKVLSNCIKFFYIRVSWRQGGQSEGFQSVGKDVLVWVAIGHSSCKLESSLQFSYIVPTRLQAMISPCSIDILSLTGQSVNQLMKDARLEFT